MKKPSFPLPGRFSRNQLLLIAAGCAVLLIAVFCLIAFALGGLPGAARPDATPESAESAQTATPEDAAPPRPPTWPWNRPPQAPCWARLPTPGAAMWTERCSSATPTLRGT